MKSFRIDPVIVIAVLALMILGTVMVYSASAVRAGRDMGDSAFFFKRQLFFSIMALLTMVIVSLIPYKIWITGAAPLLILTVGLLGVVLSPLGHTANNATRWLKLGPFSIQIAEFAKLVVVIYLARYLGGRGDDVRRDGTILMKPILILALILGLVVLEPDLGTAIFLGILGFAILFVGGVPFGRLVGLGCASIPVVVFMVMDKGFRIQRIQAFLNPWKEYEGSGFQLVQSFLAFGDGGVLGTGLGGGKSKLLFLPESHTDFILAVVGEELGFVGVAIVLALFAVLVARGMKIARNAPDNFGSLLAAGMMLLIGLQALINCMVVVGLLPTKGLPLPFMSYGGSSLLASAIAIGVVLNVASTESAA